MIKTYSQMHLADKYSQHSSMIWSVWLNGWVFVYELRGCGLESNCGHLDFRFHACFQQGVPWDSGNYRVWIHSETRTWHDENIHLNVCRSNVFNLFWKVKCAWPKNQARVRDFVHPGASNQYQSNLSIYIEITKEVSTFFVFSTGFELTELAEGGRGQFCSLFSSPYYTNEQTLAWH